MDPIFFYCVERIGRIAVFWNIAKHVVVFECPVGPAEQRESLREHPISRINARKVREYVEIIQPRRTYPGFAAAPGIPGNVLGIEFTSRVIAVNYDDWGHEVTGRRDRRRGYVVPLWELGAAPADFPKPQVSLFLSGPQVGEIITVAIADPAKLLFYSVPDVETASTDLWEPVTGVDDIELDWPKSAGSILPNTIRQA